MNNIITKESFENIKAEYGHYASWAVWSEEEDSPKSNMGNQIFLDQSIIKTLHTKYVLVALNISRSIDESFANFHSENSSATDYKTRYALKDTPLWGAYMTDIIKDFEEVASGKMMKFIKDNSGFEKQNISSFLNELTYIKAESPILVAIGNDAFNILNKNVATTFKIIKIPHYANYTSKEAYREKVLDVLDKNTIN
jgi:hypothetical protein